MVGKPNSSGAFLTLLAVFLITSSRNITTFIKSFIGLSRMPKVAIIEGSEVVNTYIEQLSLVKGFGFNPILIYGGSNIILKMDMSKITIPSKCITQFRDFNIIPGLNKLIQLFWPYNEYILNFNKAIRNFDLLHTCELFLPFSYQAVRSGKPTVVTCLENIPFNNERFAYKKFKKEVKEKADHFIAITNTAEETLKTEGIDKSRISVIPLAIDPDKFKPGPKNKHLLKRYKIPEKSTIVLTILRFVREKGVLDLVPIFDLVVKSNINVHFIVIGKGRLKKNVIRLAKKKNLLKYITFIDFVPLEKIADFHNLADIFILPSRTTRIGQEQFGFVLVEAMACEKPVVSTLIGSIPDVVKNKTTGLLVPQGDIPELAAAIIKLLDNPRTRLKFGQNGRKKVLEEFNINKTAKKIADVYRLVLNN